MLPHVNTQIHPQPSAKHPGTPNQSFTAILPCIKLNLGCGDKRLRDYVNVDRQFRLHPDVEWDLEKFPYPWRDGQVSHIYAHHVFEHITKLVELMEECHRLLAPGGKLEFVVPYGMSHAYMSDPTHVRPWTETTINYFTKGHASHIYSDCGFTVESLELLDAGPYGTPPGAWRPRLRNLIPFRRYLKFFLFGMYDQMHVVLQKA